MAEDAQRWSSSGEDTHTPQVSSGEDTHTPRAEGRLGVFKSAYPLCGKLTRDSRVFDYLFSERLGYKSVTRTKQPGHVRGRNKVVTH